MPKFIEVIPGHPLKKRIRHLRSDQFQWSEQTIDKDGDPYDYTGHTFKLEIKEYKDGPVIVEIPDASFEITQSADGLAAGVNDMFEIDHPPADFADLIAAPFEYYADIQITDAAGKPFTPIVIELLIIGD